MASIDPRRRSIALKFVYYGPAGAGKTASLRLLDKSLRSPDVGDGGPGRCGRCKGVFCLDTLGERTVYFDSLTVAVAVGADRLLLRLFSVPGEPMHRHTRRLLLRGADGVVLVHEPTSGDRCGTTPADDLSWSELRSNLRACGICVDSIPILQQPSPRAESERPLVVETLLSLVQAAWPAVKKLGAEHGLPGFESGRFVDALRHSLHTPPTAQVCPQGWSESEDRSGPLAAVWDQKAPATSPRVAP